MDYDMDDALSQYFDIIEQFPDKGKVLLNIY